MNEQELKDLKDNTMNSIKQVNDAKKLKHDLYKKIGQELSETLNDSSDLLILNLEKGIIRCKSSTDTFGTLLNKMGFEYNIYPYSEYEIQYDIFEKDTARPKNMNQETKINKDRVNIVIDEIKEVQQEYDGQAPVNVIKENLTNKYKMSEIAVNSIIEMLCSKGVIYSITKGNYTIV